MDWRKFPKPGTSSWSAAQCIALHFTKHRPPTWGGRTGTKHKRNVFHLRRWPNFPFQNDFAWVFPSSFTVFHVYNKKWQISWGPAHAWTFENWTEGTPHHTVLNCGSKIGENTPMPFQMGGYCAHAFICHMALHGPNFYTNQEYQIETLLNFGVSRARAKHQTSRVESPRTWRELGFRGLGDQGTWNFWNFLKRFVPGAKMKSHCAFCVKQRNTKCGFTLRLFWDVKEWRM